MEETGIGERIKTLRKAVGMRQQELADALGVSTNIISKWENGLARPSRGDNISKLSEALGVSPTTLMFGNTILPTEDSRTVAEKFEMLNVENKELVEMIINHQLEKQQKTLNNEGCSD